MMTEHDEQVRVIRWCRSMDPLVPGLSLLFAIPNAAKRSIRLAAYMKAEGLSAGVPDLFLPVPSMGAHGLFIELKTAKGKVTERQDEWLEALREQGYRAEVCRGHREAIDCIAGYLQMPIA